MSNLQKTSRAFRNMIQSDDEQYQRFVSESDTEKILASLRMIAKVFPEQVLMLCNRSHPALQYVSSNSLNVLGFTEQEFRSLTIENYYRTVHPDDLPALLQCFEFINSSEPYDPMTHRFVMYYRFRHKVRGYILLRDEKLAIRSDDSRYIYFTLFKDFTSEDKFHRVKLDIQEYTETGALLKVYTYHPRQPDEEMTPRQHEIFQFIIKGLSTQEIADKLNVSVNTVKNHKQLLFKKVNVKSSIELINYARTKLLISQN